MAAELVAEIGPDGLSLRELARRADVSHAAPAHHFGDRRGVFTALAAEGFALLAQSLQGTATTGFADAAVGYVSFAASHPGHFAVMFRPDLLDDGDETLLRARERAQAQLTWGLGRLRDHQISVGPQEARTAAWALVHGIASLWLAGALPGADLETVTRACAAQLFSGENSPHAGSSSDATASEAGE